MENKQHVQVPNNMVKSNLKPLDQLVYAHLKSFDGSGGCFPSQALLAKVSRLNISTVRKCINNLVKCGYISIQKKDGKTYYTFSNIKKFEPFSYEFLRSTELTPYTQAYVVAIQQYMYKDIKDFGKISYSNYQLANIMDVSDFYIRKCNNELKQKGYLVEVKNQSKDVETGCHTTTKIFDMDKLGQAIIWKLMEHEERLSYNEDRIEATDRNIQELQARIERIEKQHEDDQKLIKALMKERGKDKTEFHM